MQVNQWTGKDGGTQQGYQVVADSVISARTVRPGGKRARQQAQIIGAIPRNPRRDGKYNTPDDFDQRPPFDDEDHSERQHETQNTVVEIGYYRWPRDLAIHEAGHAIAAWFLAIRR
jgi:single-stranded DNA-binding protein